MDNFCCRLTSDQLIGKVVNLHLDLQSQCKLTTLPTCWSESTYNSSPLYISLANRRTFLTSNICYGDYRIITITFLPINNHFPSDVCPPTRITMNNVFILNFFETFFTNNVLLELRIVSFYLLYKPVTNTFIAVQYIPLC